MATKQAAEYMTEHIVPLMRKEGCDCPYDQDKYEKGEFRHKPGCPSPMIECLPNPAGLYNALRHL
jgi:hypothetical protein